MKARSTKLPQLVSSRIESFGKGGLDFGGEADAGGDLSGLDADYRDVAGLDTQHAGGSQQLEGASFVGGAGGARAESLELPAPDHVNRSGGGA